MLLDRGTQPAQMVAGDAGRSPSPPPRPPCRRARSSPRCRSAVASRSARGPTPGTRCRRTARGRPSSRTPSRRAATPPRARRGGSGGYHPDIGEVELGSTDHAALAPPAVSVQPASEQRVVQEAGERRQIACQTLGSDLFAQVVGDLGVEQAARTGGLVDARQVAVVQHPIEVEGRAKLAGGETAQLVAPGASSEQVGRTARRTLRALEPHNAKWSPRFSISQCTSSSSAGTF